jgi:hypothetical protein
MCDTGFIGWTVCALLFLAAAVMASMDFSPVPRRYVTGSPEGGGWVVGAVAKRGDSDRIRGL